MIHAVEALEEYQSNMGQQATKEKEQEEGEEGEGDDDPSPIDTKPECEVSCKPRCVKQLLHYEVYVIIPHSHVWWCLLHIFLGCI
jgi:hypothetical protein